MRVCQINTVSGVGSTGKICEGISEILDKHNIENIILFATGESGCKNAERYSNTLRYNPLSRVFWAIGALIHILIQEN